MANCSKCGGEAVVFVRNSVVIEYCERCGAEVPVKDAPKAPKKAVKPPVPAPVPERVADKPKPTGGFIRGGYRLPEKKEEKKEEEE